MALVVAYFDWPAVYGSPALLVLAYVLRTLPYALLVLWPAVRSLPPAYLEAAAPGGLRALGPGPAGGDAADPGAIAAAWGVAFALAMGELPAANLVVAAGDDRRWRSWSGPCCTGGREPPGGRRPGDARRPSAVAGTLAARGLGRAYAPWREIDS